MMRHVVADGAPEMSARPILARRSDHEHVCVHLMGNSDEDGTRRFVIWEESHLDVRPKHRCRPIEGDWSAAVDFFQSSAALFR